MDRFSNLQDHIQQLGAKMVNCQLDCEGVNHDLKSGILPRCLYFESKGREEGKGSVVVGINPGNCWEVERSFYIQHGANYESVLAYWDSTIRSVPYYERIRKFVDGLGLRGPILWTEMAKCENSVKRTPPPLQTFRRCINQHLTKELEPVAADWPIIAVGRWVYTVLSCMRPERVVIGVPHPTGARGQFSRLFENGRLRREFEFVDSEMRDGDIGRAKWAVTTTGQMGYR